MKKEDRAGSPEAGSPGASRRKICVLCKHFDFYGGSPGYSELTPGESGHMSCAKGVWKGDMEYMMAAEYRKLMLTAERCPHFELADDMRDLEAAVAAPNPSSGEGPSTPDRTTGVTHPHPGEGRP